MRWHVYIARAGTVERFFGDSRGMRELLLTAVMMSLAWTTTVTVTAQQNPREPMRGVWLANVGNKALGSREEIVDTVERCRNAGINAIFVVTWNRGVTLYPSEIMRREFGVAIHLQLAGRDPLAELIEEAHKRGIEVHGWFEFGFSSSYRVPDGGPILAKHPDWAALDREGRLVAKNGFQWMNAIRPDVQDFVLSLMKEVVANYDIDGVQGDDRLPAMPISGGYDPYTVSLYQRENDGRLPPDDPRDSAWIEWRADKLSQFVERAYRELKRQDPEVCVSWAPSVWPWSRDNYLQDWPKWAREGWGDLFCPQVYRKEIEAYRAALSAIEQQVPSDVLPRIAPGVLIALADGYDLPSERVQEMVAVNRELGFEGEVFFYYQGIEQHADVFERLYRDPAEP